MGKLDRDGRLLCELQAKAFELSVDKTECSSEIFIRRFMKSRIAKELDNGMILLTNIQAKDVVERLNEEYGVSQYGSVKYTYNEIYWIGYLYRFFSYKYGFSSAQVYKMVKPKELREVFLPYHTLDPEQAIERILEARHISFDEEAERKRQYEIFRAIRKGRGKV